MSEMNIVKAVASPLVTVRAWKIPEMKTDQEMNVPSWAMSALLFAAGKPNSGGYGVLVGQWIVRDGVNTSILHASDFRRKYITYAELPDGGVRAHFAQASAECRGKDYLKAMASYLLHLANLWEGPDGCGTYETEELGKIADKLKHFAGQSEAASKQKIMPFLYLPKTGA